MNQPMSLPNTIIIGAPKSGSSSLFYWLMAHPEVCGAKVKETHFFSDEVHPRFNASANVHQHSLEKYAEHFSHCNEQHKVILEATPIYLYSDTALRELSAFVPQPRILVIVREPSARAYSQFVFNKYRTGKIDRGMSYEQYLEVSRDKWNSPVLRGRYMRFIQRWVDRFGRSSVCVVQAEHLYADKVGEMKRVAGFLGIDPGFYDEFDFFRRNETRKMRSIFLHRLGLRLQPLIPQWIQEKVLIPFYLRLNSTSVPPTPARDKAIMQAMKADFAVDNEALAREFPNVDLERWK